jgi:hypothetical protein
VGYDESANEWIPASCLNCPERLTEFEQEEQRRLARQQSSKDSRQSRQKNTRKKRRVKIIEDDDDDEGDANGNDKNNANNNNTNKTMTSPTRSVRSSTSSSSKSIVNARKSNSITYGVEKGYKVQAILGINRNKGDQLHYLVHYQSPTSFEDNMELIPATIAKHYCEDEIIQFYETRISWNEHASN